MTRRIAAIALAAIVACTGMMGAAVSVPAAAAKHDPIVVQTVPADRVNTFFDITTVFHPSIAQTLRVRAKQRWTSITVSVFQLKRAVSAGVFDRIAAGGYDEAWFDSAVSGFATRARVTVEVWRYDKSGRIPEEFDLSGDFTRVHRSTSARIVRAGADLTLPVRRGLDVTPGDYAVVITPRFADPLMFNLRLAGQENGRNTMGGYDHDVPVDCTYTPSRDANPGGQAYRPVPDGTFPPGSPPRPVPTRYEAVDTKVATSCDLTGVYDPDAQIWNPGDVRMIIRGSRG